MKHLIAAGIILYRLHNQNIEFLLVKHRHGHWEFPKGKLDEGETIQEAALRELTEETGLQATLIQEFHETISYVFIDHFTNCPIQKMVHFFLGQATSCTVVLSDEHLDSAWLSYEHAYTSLTHRQSQILAHKAHTFIQNKVLQLAKNS